MKFCSSCDEEKSRADFHLNAQNRDGLSSICRACKRDYDTARRNARRELLNEIKRKRGCSMCGYREHARALHFHHEDPSLKELTVSEAYMFNVPQLLAEVEKCVVLCANCHAVSHSERPS